MIVTQAVAAALAAAGAGAAAAAVASAYLARLTLSVPDREDRRWWVGRPAGGARSAATGLTGACLGASAGAAAGWQPVLAVLLAIALVETPLLVIDVEHHRLPDRLVLTGYAIALVGFTAVAISCGDVGRLGRTVAAAAVVFGCLLALALISPASFGFGDVKLGGLVAAPLGWLGWGTVLAGIVGAFLLAGVAATALLAARRATLTTALPFGPALIAGAALAAALGLGTR